jgi:hypothetical protein
MHTFMIHASFKAPLKVAEMIMVDIYSYNKILSIDLRVI